MANKTTVRGGISLTENCASKVAFLLEQEGRSDLRLRIAVEPGGCSGLRYEFSFDNSTLNGDSFH